jgi:deoxyribodipyrimidine photo-lyase
MDTAIVLLTRDLRVHDNPALATACARARQVVPAFIIDPALTAVSANRTCFLLDCLDDLRGALRDRGGDLVIRQGEPAAEAVRLAGQTGAEGIFIADDVSRYADRRRRELGRECRRHRLELVITPGPAVVPPGDLHPAGGDHYKVFTPYWHAWAAAAWRPAAPTPTSINLPPGVPGGPIPPHPAGSSPGLAPGGETAGRRQMRRWLDGPLADYPTRRDDPAEDETSRLSAYLRFGCICPLALARAARQHPRGEQYCRQLAWRDFFYQVTAAFSDMATRDYRPRQQQRWHDDPDALQAWRDGRTGIPIVDAGLRQLAAEGFMHNRVRMITASFLTRDLRIHWRHGYRHFSRLLADGDVANNAGNWQWMAGTGNHTRPGRVLSPLRQAHRFDRAGDYVRRYIPELAHLHQAHIHAPWTLPGSQRRQLGYPAPILDPGG